MICNEALEKFYFTFFEEKNENPLSTSGKTITDSRILQIHTNVQQFHKLQIQNQMNNYF